MKVEIIVIECEDDQTGSFVEQVIFNVNSDYPFRIWECMTVYLKDLGLSEEDAHIASAETIVRIGEMRSDYNEFSTDQFDIISIEIS